MQNLIHNDDVSMLELYTVLYRFGECSSISFVLLLRNTFPHTVDTFENKRTCYKNNIHSVYFEM